jgi:hypothetical protein
LQLLKFFRQVILQDSCILLEDELYSKHRIFQHKIFKATEFTAFKEKVTASHYSLLNPDKISDNLIQKEFREVKTFVSSLFNQYNVEKRQENDTINTTIEKIERKFDDFLSGKFFILEF